MFFLMDITKGLDAVILNHPHKRIMVDVMSTISLLGKERLLRTPSRHSDRGNATHEERRLSP